MTISVDLKSTMTISVDLKWSMTIRVDLKPTKTIRVNLKSFHTKHWSTTVFLYPILVDHGLFIIRHLNWGYSCQYFPEKKQSFYASFSVHLLGSFLSILMVFLIADELETKLSRFETLTSNFFRKI